MLSKITNFSLFKDGFQAAFSVIYIWTDWAKDHKISVSFWTVALHRKPNLLLFHGLPVITPTIICSSLLRMRWRTASIPTSEEASFVFSDKTICTFGVWGNGDSASNHVKISYRQRHCWNSFALLTYIEVNQFTRLGTGREFPVGPANILWLLPL